MPRSMLTIALGGLLACGSDATDPGADPDTPTDPTPYVVDAQAPPEAASSLADVTAQLQVAIDLARSVNAGPVRAAYDEVMAHSNGVCPFYYATEDGAYWLDSCASDSGANYDGYVFSLDQSVSDPESGASQETWYAFGAATVVDPSGQQLELGGAAILQSAAGVVGAQQTPFRTFVSQLQGSFRWDGPSASDTFLASDLDPDFSLSFQDFGDGLARIATLGGGFGGFSQGWAVAFDENLIFSELLGSSCEQEPSGTIAVRSPAGQWYDVRFDGPVDENDQVAAADCDGCGTAYFQGVEFGSVCVDFASLTDWETTPW